MKRLYVFWMFLLSALFLFGCGDSSTTFDNSRGEDEEEDVNNEEDSAESDSDSDSDSDADADSDSDSDSDSDDDGDLTPTDDDSDDDDSDDDDSDDNDNDSEDQSNDDDNETSGDDEDESDDVSDDDNDTVPSDAIDDTEVETENDTEDNQDDSCPYECVSPSWQCFGLGGTIRNEYSCSGAEEGCCDVGEGTGDDQDSESDSEEPDDTEDDDDADDDTSESNGECSVLLSGGTGDEAGGMIPVCCAPTAEEQALIDEVFVLLNEHRAANGVGPLTYDKKLEAAMQGHCIHMNEHSFFDHYAPEQSVYDPWQRASECDASASSENIANGYSTAREVMDGWISSSGHNQNMLNGQSTRVGIGYVNGGQWNTYWGQLFGN